jgi:3-phenylpropionate/trans-cinnamate dioxygenase ferredoxin component
MSADGWVAACDADEIEAEDVISVELAGRMLAIYRSPQSTFHATDGLCTHEYAELADGLVMGDVIECPKHNGRFNYKTGEATRVPARVNLCTYPVKVDAGTVFVKLS